MGCTASRPQTLEDGPESRGVSRDAALPARLSAKQALAKPVSGKSGSKRTNRTSKLSAFKPPLPATPELSAEDYGSLPELLNSTSSVGSVTTSILGARNSSDRDASNRTTSSSFGSRGDESGASTLQSPTTLHRLSQASTIEGNRSSLDTSKMGTLRTTLDSDSLPHSNSAQPESDEPLWRTEAVSGSSAPIAPSAPKSRFATSVGRDDGVPQRTASSNLDGLGRASDSLDGDSASSARAVMKNIAFNINANMYHRPTYERDAVDDEFAAANGLSLPRFMPKRTVAIALENAAEARAADSRSKGDVSFQAYSDDSLPPPPQPNVHGSVIFNGDMHDLAADDLDSPAEHNMGSLTGWQAIAAQVMEEGDDDSDFPDTPMTPATPSPRKGNRFGSIAMESPRTPRTPRGGKARYGSIVDIASRQQAQQPITSSPAVAFQPGGGFYVQYECQEALGAGAFGEAIKARRRKDGQMFVVKKMLSNTMTTKAKEEARNEVHVLATLDHPNIVKYYESFLDQHDGRLLIVMELCEEGDLDNMLKKRAGVFMSEDEIMMKFVQICLGLMHVHNKGIIHRDLKTNNIFCCKDGIVKLGDFGISKMLTGGEKIARTMVGTPYYMSPEIIKGRKYDAKTDVWAVGCVLYELCALRKAFDASNLAAITVRVMSGKIPPIPDHYSEDMKELIHKLIQRKPDARPALPDVLALAFVRKHILSYQQHVLQHVNIKQRAYYVQSLAQYLTPEHAQDLQSLDGSEVSLGKDLVRRNDSETSMVGRRNSNLSVTDRQSAVSSRASSTAGARKEEIDAMVREMRSREEATSREKLRAFKAQRPRAKSRTMELLGDRGMHASASAPDLMQALRDAGSAGSGGLPSPSGLDSSPGSSVHERSGSASLPPLPPAPGPDSRWAPPASPGAAADADAPSPATPAISTRSAGALLGDIQAILQQPAVSHLDDLAEESSIMEALPDDFEPASSNASGA
ncbi:hypothetical protein WJX73_006988 [Symbiochloris irregularis]|uniref:non-specific serine/threonine protein kinase n=1 Tax=Symbiochloris irregularis TaxID=706552 RepID=A0AAW1PIV9_9CHLO